MEAGPQANRRDNLFILSFCLILLLGIIARTWEFGTMPPGLNIDEASIGIEAFNLYRFGVDRNGISLPVHLISWGSGQNALYAYLLIPFIAIGGLTPYTVRLPMLLSGILTLPLVYFVARQTIDRKFALLSMFLLAISPWHILLSRWGLESNILPFVFLTGYACLLKSTPTNKWFILACFFFALCLYSYGTAYAAIPIFVLMAVLILLRWKRLSIRNMVMGLVILIIVGFPIGLFVLVNTLKLKTIHLSRISIPRLPARPRFETVGLIFSGQFFKSLAQNLATLWKVLWKQNDGLVWSSVVPFGYFYFYTFPLAVIGAVRLALLRKPDKRPEQLLLLAWLVTGLFLGVLQPANFNRINLAFIPIILCIAVFLTWLGERSKIAEISAIVALLICFAFFTISYHSEEYRKDADIGFNTGFLPALDFARQTGDNPICVTKTVFLSYIYVLFSEQVNPANYLKNIDYVLPGARLREVRSLGRYTFGLRNCSKDPRTIYVLRDELPPENGIPYKVKDFEYFNVYTP